MATSQRKKKDRKLPPPSIARIFRNIARLGRRKNIEEPTTPIIIQLKGCCIEDEGAIALLHSLEHAHVHCSLLDLSLCGLSNLSATHIARWLANDNKCSTLCLQGNEIGDIGGAAIARALQNNTTMTSLRIENNKLGEVAGNAFARTLRTNSTAFKELNLLANPLGSSGVSPIFLSLASNRARVMNVALRRCDIDCSGIIVLADALRSNETIISLDLQSNLIGDDGAAALASSLKHDNRTLRILDVRDNLISTGMYALEDMIQTNRSIRLLQIEGNDFAGDWASLNKRVQKQMDFNEIGYWKVVEKELKEERERLEAVAEAATASAIEKELLKMKKLKK